MVRRYHHGGALAGITRDWFPGLGRAIGEIRASERLRHSGIATPEILAVYSKRSLLGLRRSCLLSRLVPDGENLRQWVRRNNAGAGAWRPMMQRVAGGISDLHAAGCFHRDLNLSNLLVSSGRIWILDLDGAKLEDPLGIAPRGRNILRLYRSLIRESGRAEPLSPRDRVRFLRHYARKDRRLLRLVLAWSNAHGAGVRLRASFRGGAS